jgi:hypothetical protein
VQFRSHDAQFSFIDLQGMRPSQRWADVGGAYAYAGGMCAPGGQLSGTGTDVA